LGSCVSLFSHEILIGCPGASTCFRFDEKKALLIQTPTNTPCGAFPAIWPRPIAPNSSTSSVRLSCARTRLRGDFDRPQSSRAQNHPGAPHCRPGAGRRRRSRCIPYGSTVIRVQSKPVLLRCGHWRFNVNRKCGTRLPGDMEWLQRIQNRCTPKPRHSSRHDHQGAVTLHKSKQDAVILDSLSWAEKPVVRQLRSEPQFTARAAGSED
jgi:hypothetical protein